MKLDLTITHLGIMAESVSQASTELLLPKFCFVVVTPATNLPEKDKYFVRPIGGMWPKQESLPISRGEEASILVHGTEVISITDMQMVFFTKVVERQNVSPDLIWMNEREHTLMVQFPHILIGIEPDGYAHS